MRLGRLEIENLASLEGVHVVDFERDLGHAPMFVVVGPTGAGKSTLLDAIALALFGETPRLSNARGGGSEDLDARHIMTRGSGRCRAVLEFKTRESGDGTSTRWRATWSARRANNAPDGALQRPVRSLERWSPGNDRWLVLVDDDRKKVWEPAFSEALAGLGVAEFQRSMLLAQGEFAALLTAPPADKGHILERLTSTHLYLDIGRRCAEQTRAAQAELHLVEQQLGGSAPPDPTEITRAAERVGALEADAQRLDSVVQELELAANREEERAALDRDEATVASERARLAADRAARAAVAEIEIHQAVAEVALRKLASAEELLASVESAMARGARDDSGDEPGMNERRVRIERLVSEAAELRKASDKFAAREAELALLDGRLTNLQQTVEALRRTAAREALAQAMERHRADLVAGEPCPLCGSRAHPFGSDHTRPGGDAGAALARAERELKTAELARRALADNLSHDRAAGARANALIQQAESEREALALLRERAVNERETRLAESRTRHELARRARDEAHAEHVRAQGEVAAACSRHGVASLDAARAARIPAVERDRMVSRLARHEERRAALTSNESTQPASARSLIDARAERAATWQALGGEKRVLADLVQRQTATAALAATWESTRARVDLWRRLYRLIGERDGQAFREFAQIMNLEVLVDCANRQLGALAPRYRLTTAEDRAGRARLDFAVRDMAQAGRTRPVTTLSGGETFLVSLALALGLADLRTSALPIETLLLDEGFGTLDAEALDLALTALAELQARTGLQLGIVTHVGAVSERIPARVVVEPIVGSGGSGPSAGRSRVRVVVDGDESTA